MLINMKIILVILCLFFFFSSFSQPSEYIILHKGDTVSGKVKILTKKLIL